MLPVWYKTAKPLIDSGKLTMLGVVQEQHAERAQLYKQWKQYDFPIVQDATTSLNLAVVPVPLFVDEYGIIRNSRPRPNDLGKFVAQTFEDDASNEKTDQPNESSDVEKLIAKGNTLLHDVAKRDVEQAIEVLSKAVEAHPKNSKAKFSLGVAMRMRFDSKGAHNGDFATAAKLWAEALAMNPNQYIWRRRIEQYGPRLGKPYPFYNWVDNAIADIKKRGEEPVELTVNFTGTELAGPVRKFDVESGDKNPDPQSQIVLAGDELVQLSPSVVRAAVQPSSVVRVHLNLKPINCKWNDEAGPLMVWVDESSDGSPQKRLLEFPLAESQSPEQTRNIDFEFKAKGDSAQSSVTGFALFHICDDDGVCVYKRKDFEINIGGSK